MLKNDKTVTPFALYYITAQLIKEKIISVVDIWPHLGPNDDEITQTFVNKM